MFGYIKWIVMKSNHLCKCNPTFGSVELPSSYCWRFATTSYGSYEFLTGPILRPPTTNFSMVVQMCGSIPARHIKLFFAMLTCCFTFTNPYILLFEIVPYFGFPFPPLFRSSSTCVSFSFSISFSLTFVAVFDSTSTSTSGLSG
ncbi:zinc finger BED domain-containing protein RICESLEEPER 2 [Iris pallida]|uniref:Zinc finger BED domain-containing protein RICESLEEPER 2 n=1 Tax=Iris pallida TaxID=29817 RepID=A0AAX6H0Q9_IRIPA|nr:zinc finger BED domain-containing protein RICESLEEPER 2 [Iris pallida]